MSDFLIPKDVYKWFSDNDGEPEGWEEVDREETPGKHDCHDVHLVLKHEASGRFLQVSFSTSYNYGWDEYSFYASEVFPHVVTTTVYKGKPAP